MRLLRVQRWRFLSPICITTVLISTGFNIGARILQHACHSTHIRVRMSRHAYRSTHTGARISKHAYHGAHIAARISDHAYHSTHLTARISQHACTHITARISECAHHSRHVGTRISRYTYHSMRIRARCRSTISEHDITARYHSTTCGDCSPSGSGMRQRAPPVRIVGGRGFACPAPQASFQDWRPH